jgi:hypothetical protein
VEYGIAGATIAGAMVLNQDLSFSDVRYLISSRVGVDNRQISYDSGLSFTGVPPKVLLPQGTTLVRLDFPVWTALFMKVWWMTPEALRRVLEGAGPEAADMRREWQHQQAMPKPSKGVRTQIIEIILTAPVYAWVGDASPLFHRAGGAEQVYLPNLAKGAGPNRSDYARLLHTYTLPAVQ